MRSQVSFGISWIGLDYPTIEYCMYWRAFGSNRLPTDGKLPDTSGRGPPCGPKGGREWTPGGTSGRRRAPLRRHGCTTLARPGQRGARGHATLAPRRRGRTPRGRGPSQACGHGPSAGRARAGRESGAGRARAGHRRGCECGCGPVT